MSGPVSGSVLEPGFPAHHVSQRSKAVFDAVVSSENVEIPLGHPVLEQNEEFGPLVLHGLPLKSPVVQKTNETQPPMQHTPYTWFDNPELDPKFQHGAIVLERSSHGLLEKPMYHSLPEEGLLKKAQNPWKLLKIEDLPPP